MKFENILFILIAGYMVLDSFTSVIEARKYRNLQTQIDELRIIVNQKYLPAMIFNKEDFNIR